jgi:hypothetical protein
MTIHDDEIKKALGVVEPVTLPPVTEAVAVFQSIERAVASATQGEVEKAKLEAQVASQQAKLDSDDFREQLKLDGERQKHESRIATIVVLAVVALLLLLVGTAVLLFATRRSDDGRQILLLVFSFLGGGGIGGTAGFAKGWTAHAKQSSDVGGRTTE